jgi:hypothetical protein
MDSCSYRSICRRYYNFRWRICSSIPIACTVRIYDSFCTCLEWICYGLAASTHSILQAVDGIALKRAGLPYTAFFKAGSNRSCLLHQYSLGEYDRHRVLHCDHIRFHYPYLEYHLCCRSDFMMVLIKNLVIVLIVSCV